MTLSKSRESIQTISSTEDFTKIYYKTSKPKFKSGAEHVVYDILSLFVQWTSHSIVCSCYVGRIVSYYKVWQIISNFFITATKRLYFLRSLFVSSFLRSFLCSLAVNLKNLWANFDVIFKYVGKASSIPKSFKILQTWLQSCP